MFLCYWSTNLHTLEWISISISIRTIQNSSSSTFGPLNINLIPGICDWPLFVNSHSTLELWTVYVHVKLVCKGEFDLKVARKWNQIQQCLTRPVIRPDATCENFAEAMGFHFTRKCNRVKLVILVFLSHNVDVYIFFLLTLKNATTI